MIFYFCFCAVIMVSGGNAVDNFYEAPKNMMASVVAEEPNDDGFNTEDVSEEIKKYYKTIDIVESKYKYSNDEFAKKLIAHDKRQIEQFEDVLQELKKYNSGHQQNINKIYLEQFEMPPF